MPHSAAMPAPVEPMLRNLLRAVEQCPVSIVITDVRGVIEYVNPKFTEATGYSPAEALGRNPRILKSGQQSPAFYQELWETITSGHEWRGEFHNRRKNGELFWEAASISPIRDADGQVTRFVAVKEDITERKLLLDRLCASEENYRRLFEQMLLGFAVHEMIFDAHGQPSDYRFLQVNSAFEKLTGLQAHQVIGRTVHEVLPGTEAFWIEQYGQVALTGEPARFIHFSSVLRRYFEVAAFRPAPRQVAVMFQDVTEHREHELARERVIAELRQSADQPNPAPGLTPICSSCKNIRDAQGAWHKVESYFEQHGGVRFTHGICPVCIKIYFPEL